MLTLPGFRDLVVLDADGHTRVYRAVDEHDGAAVVLKAPIDEGPDAPALERLRLEHAILDELAFDGVPHARALLPHGRSLVLVLDDIVGERLDASLRRTPLSIERFFEIALPIVESLARVHARGVIHRDLRPRNVILNHATGQLQIVEFGAASRVRREPRSPAPLDQLEGALAYLSPEQTGRMNRAVDYRADFYALGAMFYEMLTGQLPFLASDALELVHCHLARAPVPPAAQRPEIPAPLSDLVVKLLAKLAEDRYQSGAGLRADLQRCQREWLAARRIEPFDLGSNDASDRFVLTQRLYGREHEVEALLAAFRRVATRGRPELVLVAGYSGVGKSMLVAELQKPIVAQRGYFIEGKVEHHGGERPYAALFEALRALLRQMLTAPAARLAAWRERLLAALGDNAQVIVELAPQLHLIIGAQPMLGELPPEQERARLHRSVVQFIAAIAQPEHPLLLFLDDLQWADAGSLTLLTELVGHAQMRHLLVLGAYRDNEVGADHPLRQLPARLEQHAVPHATLTLAPLRQAHIAQVLADTLHCNLSEAAPLAATVLAKTGGNPFFALQFITALHTDGLIRFDPARQRWAWDGGQLAGRSFTDSIVELMLAELMRLPAPTRHLLALAGFLGSRFAARTLAIVAAQPPGALAGTLRPALVLGLLARDADGYRFLHDRVHEAAYALTPHAQRPALHWQIGCRLLDGLSGAVLDAQCFEVVEHLNRGADTADARHDTPHRHAAARLNLRAGNVAQSSTAYVAAASHFEAGVTLLGGWEADHPLAFALHLGRARNRTLRGEFALAAAQVEELQARSRDDIEWAQAALINIDLNVSRHDADVAADVAVDCLRRLGVEVPRQPTREQIQQGCDEHLALLAGRPIESLAALPRMTDARLVIAMRVLARAQTTTFFTANHLSALLACRMVILSQQHGLSSASVTGFAGYGLMLLRHSGDRRSAYAYSRLAVDLSAQHGTPFDRASATGQLAMVGAWVLPLRQTQGFVREAAERALQTGDLIGTVNFAQRLVLDGLMHGDPLAELADRADEFLGFATRANYRIGIDTLTLRRQQIRALRGQTRGLGSLDDAGFDTHAFVTRKAPIHSPLILCWLQIARLALHCIAGDAAAGHAAACVAEPLLETEIGLFTTSDFQCFAALCRAALHDQVEPAQRPALRERLGAHERQLAEWAELNPDNFQHSHWLVAAEIARIDGRPLQAMAAYQRSIASAHAQGFVQIEALAHERAAAFYRHAGAGVAAHAHLRAARDAYARWGAEAKLRQLDTSFPELASLPAPWPERGELARLDALAVVKATRAIAGQTEPASLQRELLTIALQQAGAQRGALLLAQGDDLVAAATARGDGPAIEVTLSSGDVPTDGSWIPASVVSYVRRSAERVLLDDARAVNPFAGDAAFADGAARAVLALPIVRQAIVTGVLYLEHRDAPGVFTLDRVALLEQVAAQAAVSLESTRLYAELADHKRTLEAAVDARTLELRRSRNVLQTVVDGMPAMVALKGRDGRFLMHNRRYAALLGRGGESLIGLRVADIVDGGSAANAEAEDARVLATETGLSIEEDLPVVGGPRTFQVNKFPVRDDHGTVYAVGTVSIDITDLKAARLDAEAAAQAKSQFLANMSHEIRTPMNAILGMAHLALRSGLNAQQHSYVQKVDHSARALLGLVNDILDFSKVEAGKLELDTRPFELQDVLDHLESAIGLQAAEKGLELVFDCAADVPGSLVGDPMRLGQVLVNLGNNAVKFTASGEVTLGIRVAARDGTGVTLAFEVIDTGVGMGTAERERLFKPFMQADPSTSRRYGGTGLGLAISWQLAQLLGGSIGVQSAPGQGSTFRFDARLGVQSVVVPPPGHVPSAGLRVLVVDDNARARDAIVSMCAAQGWHVDAVAGGEEALRQLAADAGTPYRLVLVDAQMPVMDGVQCLQRLAGTLPPGAAAVLMCSAFGREALMKRVARHALTPAGVLSKPVAMARLVEVCAIALGEREAPDSRAQRVATIDTRHRARLRGTRILLVEDNPINQELALELLRDAGVSVAVAAHGREAIAILERENFDGVLMDCQMPVLDGYAATREIRQQARWAALPIIAMTANVMAADQQKALAAGMNDHISKPIDVDTMYATIARWIHAPDAPRPPPAPRAGAGGGEDLATLLTGIDTHAGLTGTGGNEKLYRRLLVKFREAERDFVAAFRAAFERGDRTTATRLAHDLRAVAGTLGAQQLERQAQLLEAECRAGGSDVVIETLLDQVAEELAPVMQGLQALG